jgi:hypothetical protein
VAVDATAHNIANGRPTGASSSLLARADEVIE